MERRGGKIETGVITQYALGAATCCPCDGIEAPVTFIQLFSDDVYHSFKSDFMIYRRIQYVEYYPRGHGAHPSSHETLIFIFQQPSRNIFVLFTVVTQFCKRERSAIASLVFMGLAEKSCDICNFCVIKNSDVRDCGDVLFQWRMSGRRRARGVL